MMCEGVITRGLTPTRSPILESQHGAEGSRRKVPALMRNQHLRFFRQLGRKKEITEGK